MQPIINYIKNPNQLFLGIVKKTGGILPEDLYLRLYYLCKTGEKLHLRHPKTFNEKLQWLKLYNRRPEYAMMVDKYTVKDYVADILGKDFIIPTIGVWDTPEEIDWETLPQQFVIKTTHGGGGGGVIICTNKHTLDRNEVIKKLNYSLKSDIYKEFREWPYKNVKHRIIAEQCLSDKGVALKDYKFFCFSGIVRMFKIDFDRFVTHRANYYNREGEILPFGEADYPPVFEKELDLPENLSEMITIAEKLSKGSTFMRIDLYNCNGRIYFGEITFYPASGLGRFTDKKWEKYVGDWIELPN